MIVFQGQYTKVSNKLFVENLIFFSFNMAFKMYTSDGFGQSKLKTFWRWLIILLIDTIKKRYDSWEEIKI